MARLVIPKFKSTHHLLVLLFAVWVVLFTYHERIVPLRTAGQCRWPQIDTTGTDTVPQHVLLVADPQLIDNHTYPGRNSLLLDLSKHTVDTHLKRNYHALLSALHPDTVFFLGDYLDNGRESSDAYYAGEVARFNRIFYPKRIQKNYEKGKNWFTNVPGNHDIGFGDSVRLPARTRFQEDFGSPNTIVVENGVDFVMIDSPSYSAEDTTVNSVARNFIDTLPEKSRPRILLTHEPLYRPREQSCGPLREHPVFYSDQKGYQYQNTVAPELSELLIAAVKPDLVFSGDDHDYCDIEHSNGPREVTVKSISLAMGIRKPAVQLLTYAVVDNQLRYDTNLCYVQTPYTNVIHYIVLAVACGLLLLWWNIKQRPSRYNYSILPMVELTSTSRKISNFLEEQDDTTGSRSNFVPQYTHTAAPSGMIDHLKSSGFSRDFQSQGKKVSRFMRKWNLYSFLRHVAASAATIIVFYYLVFGRI
ncbi:cell division control protein 1 [Diutina catenulata]